MSQQDTISPSGKNHSVTTLGRGAIGNVSTGAVTAFAVTQYEGHHAQIAGAAIVAAFVISLLREEHLHKSLLGSAESAAGDVLQSIGGRMYSRGSSLATPSSSQGTDLTEVNGIGSSYAQKLQNNGYGTVQKLLSAPADMVANDVGVSPKQVQQWQSDAQTLLSSQASGNSGQ